MRGNVAACHNGRPQSLPDLITLASILPRLPAEAQAWIKGLDADDYTAMETILNNVGAENFIKHWKVHHDDYQKFEYDFWDPSRPFR